MIENNTRIMKHLNSIYSSTIILCCICQITFSQSPKWMSEMEVDVLRDWKIIYKKPNKFNQVVGNDCFNNNPKLKSMMKCGGNQLHSRNGDFIVFNMIGTVFTRDVDDEPLIVVLPGIGKPPYTLEGQFISYIKNDIVQLFGEKAASNWKNHVNYSSNEKTVNKFNSDVVISYSINLEPKDYYKGVYNNLWVLVIRKKNRGYVRMYFLYKDISNRKLAKYKTNVESIYKYED